MEATIITDPGIFTYILPDERIAKYPLEERSESKLLIYKDHIIQEGQFKGIIDILPGNGLMIFNETKVIQARLHFRKDTGAAIEIFCLEPHEPSEYALSLGAMGSCSWKCLIGNSKKWKTGPLERKVFCKGLEITLYAERLKKQGNSSILRFFWENRQISFAEILESAGEIPLPPYLNRIAEASDKERYQTVYAFQEGSVAAPTAGLHFTQAVLDKLSAKGLLSGKLCLHVGAGTFKPVQTHDIRLHEMHTEHFSVSRNLIQQLYSHEGPVIAVGTTSVRTLESLYHSGRQLLEKGRFDCDIPHIAQWCGMQESTLSKQESLKALLEYMDKHQYSEFEASTQIMIIPGYTFRMTDVLITNFHQPGSTLLMLIAAFAGPGWKEIYQYALEHSFRFLSYGDSSILFRTEGRELF